MGRLPFSEGVKRIQENPEFFIYRFVRNHGWRTALTFVAIKYTVMVRLQLLLILIVSSACAFAGDTLYVRANGSSPGSGSSWTDAFIVLQDAIDAAQEEDVICVAAGTYFPTTHHGSDTARNKTFYVDKKIALYGGFSGEPGTEGDFAGRDHKTFATILSGDVGVPDFAADNCFHVVYLDHVPTGMRLDGFIITGGNTVGAEGFDAYGAGIYNDAVAGNSHPVIAHCTIRINRASEGGAGLFNNALTGGKAKPQLISCTFQYNSASAGGAISGITDEGGEVSPTLLSCTLIANTALTSQGSALQVIAHSGLSQPRFVNCLVSGNHAPFASAIEAFVTGTGQALPELINCTVSGNTGGTVRVTDLGLKLSELKVRNSILWGNAGGHGVSTNGALIDVAFSLIQFGIDGEGNRSDDPMFTEPAPLLDSAHTIGNLHLLPGSPAIDAGRNSDVPVGVETDLDALPRFVNVLTGEAGPVDIGAYESQGMTSSIRHFAAPEAWSMYPNPASGAVTISLNTDFRPTRYSFIDAYGRVCLTDAIGEGDVPFTVDLDHLQAGLYTVVLSGEQMISSRQVVIIYEQD